MKNERIPLFIRRNDKGNYNKYVAKMLMQTINQIGTYGRKNNHSV